MKALYSKGCSAALLVVSLAAVGLLDYAAGYELRLGALYAAIVAYATWHFGAAIGVLVSIVCVSVGHWTEWATGKVYLDAWIAYANSASRWAIFLFVVFSFGYFRRTIDRTRAQVRAFKGKLPICCCCHRIDGGDSFWVDFPTYLRRNSDVTPEFLTCPTCVNSGKAEGIKPVSERRDS